LACFLEHGPGDAPPKFRARCHIAREGDAGEQPHLASLFRELRELSGPLRKELAENGGRYRPGNGVIIWIRWRLRRRNDGWKSGVQPGGT